MLVWFHVMSNQKHENYAIFHYDTDPKQLQIYKQIIPWFSFLTCLLIAYVIGKDIL